MPFDLRQPRLSRAERDAARGKLARMRAETLAALLAGVTREALAEGRIASKFGYEAVFRSALRSTFCLQGWRWSDADAAAARVVQISLELVQAERPSWNEGQPEWTIDGGALIERTRCANCGNPLPEDRPRFCCDLCRKAYHLRLFRLRSADASRAADMAIRGGLTC